MTPIQYCRNKEIRTYATYHYNSSNGGFYLHEGKSYSESEFKKAFPLSHINIKVEDNYKGPNSNRTKEWMVD